MFGAVTATVGDSAAGVNRPLCVPQALGAGAPHEGTGEQPSEGPGGSHTPAAGGGRPGAAETTVGSCALCLLSFAQWGPLSRALSGAVLRQAGRVL